MDIVKLAREIQESAMPLMSFGNISISPELQAMM